MGRLLFAGTLGFGLLLASVCADAALADRRVALVIGNSAYHYMIPVDAKLASDRDAEDEAITLDRLFASVEGARGTGCIAGVVAKQPTGGNCFPNRKHTKWFCH